MSGLDLETRLLPWDRIPVSELSVAIIIYTVLLPGNDIMQVYLSTFIGGAACGAIVGIMLGLAGFLVFGSEV